VRSFFFPIISKCPSFGVPYIRDRAQRNVTDDFLPLTILEGAVSAGIDDLRDDTGPAARVTS
jgi:hypothetical protein